MQNVQRKHVHNEHTSRNWAVCTEVLLTLFVLLIAHLVEEPIPYVIYEYKHKFDF
jgi:hypothetical protein